MGRERNATATSGTDNTARAVAPQVVLALPGPFQAEDGPARGHCGKCTSQNPLQALSICVTHAMGRAIESTKRTTSSACCTSAGSSSTACRVLRGAPLVRSSPCQAVDEVEQEDALLRRGEAADPARFPHAGGYPGLWRQLPQQVHAAQPSAVLVDHAQLKNITADHAPHARQGEARARQA